MNLFRTGSFIFDSHKCGRWNGLDLIMVVINWPYMYFCLVTHGALYITLCIDKAGYFNIWHVIPCDTCINVDL